MARIEIVPGTLAQVHQVVDNLRAIDRHELTITAGDADQAVLLSWKASGYRGIFQADGEPIVAFGVAPCTVLIGDGRPWMVATERINEVSREFLLASRDVIERMRVGYAELRNATHKDNEVSLNWLRWLGFRISDEPVGPGGLMRIFSMPGLPGGEGQSNV